MELESRAHTGLGLSIIAIELVAIEGRSFQSPLCSCRPSRPVPCFHQSSHPGTILQHQHPSSLPRFQPRLIHCLPVLTCILTYTPAIQELEACCVSPFFPQRVTLLSLTVDVRPAHHGVRTNSTTAQGDGARFLSWANILAGEDRSVTVTHSNSSVQAKGRIAQAKQGTTALLTLNPHDRQEDS